MLPSSSGINYVLNEHEDVDQYGPYATPSKLMTGSYPAILENRSEIATMLTSSSDSNYVPNEHEYDPCAKTSEIKPCKSSPERLVNQTDILVDSLC